jgi:hypothetical protein
MLPILMMGRPFPSMLVWIHRVPFMINPLRRTERINWLDSFVAFSNKCWKKMKCIHFILPNMSETGQDAMPKQASILQYKTKLHLLKSDWRSNHYGQPVELSSSRFMNRTRNIWTNFCMWWILVFRK